MNHIKELYEKYEEAQSIADERKAELEANLRPLLDISGVNPNDRIDSISFYYNHAFISYSWDACGGGSDTITIPMEIIEARDPVAALTQRKAEEKLKRDQAELAKKQAELDRLAESLGMKVEKK